MLMRKGSLKIELERLSSTLMFYVSSIATQKEFAGDLLNAFIRITNPEKKCKTRPSPIPKLMDVNAKYNVIFPIGAQFCFNH